MNGPTVLPEISVTVPGGDLFAITPKVKTTEVVRDDRPVWLWLVLAGLGLWALSRGAGRGRRDW